MNIALIPNRDKPDAVAAAQHLLELLSADVACRSEPGGRRVAVLANPTAAELAAFKPGLAVVLGGDGSILSTAQVLAPMRVPVVGINFGKLGYLAAFSLEEFLQHRETILCGRAPQVERLMLHASIYPWDGADGIQSRSTAQAMKPRASGIALNDVVINSGDPFRMIELEVQIDEVKTTTFRSDGVIVSTASGSTGYNLSAGGPLVSPEVEAMVLTPICPHSLSFRPVVLPATSWVLIIPRRLNSGTKVSFDGQVTYPIRSDECLLIGRAATPFVLIENPGISHWQMLATKLLWARSPRQ